MHDRVHKDISSIMLSEEEIEEIVKKIAKKINSDYDGEEITVVVILRGSVVFAADLIRQLDMPVRLEFMQVSSYGNRTESSGFVQIKKDLDGDIFNKNVLVIEDIVDSGNTLYRLSEIMKERNPKSLKICTLLDKPSRRKSDVFVDYIGAKIEDEFVVGYGLDYNEMYRNLPYIGILKKEIYS